ncbi:hypothetical protein CIB95_09360 [Lottiidibacillus patelloidae]|uniref:Aminoglycoside phosphotransferase domain-containing protein n=1 Tax=Lottiidibacillus patelloidae TaxID=2670334 RepID=A0A263BTS6_9BACI|nr:phosphotransferase [Lottiidibacillus patelloidae]OZM56968.1 hypothetical protein CIB95_09360 [Lottiidibacillus patelloidae]
MQDITNILEKYYNIKPLKIEKIRKVYKISSSEGDYCLKEYKNKEHESLHFQMEVLHHLQGNNFQSTYTIIPTIEKKLLISHNNHTYFLADWINGEAFNFSNLNQLKKAAQALANLHNYSLKLNVNKEVRVRSSFHKPPQFLHVKIGPYYNSMILERLLYLQRKYSYHELLTAIQLFEEAISFFPYQKYKKLWNSEQKEQAFVHGDYNYSNIILSPNNNAFLIDFDNVNFNIRITDLIFLIQLHMGTDGRYISDILRSYHQIRPLSQLEFDIIKSQLLVPAKAYWKMNIQEKVQQELTPSFIKSYISPFLKRDLFAKVKNLSFEKVFITEKEN